MQFPLAVAAPAVRREIPALGGAAALTLVRAAVVLAEPWPLAMAVDYAINRKPMIGPLAMFTGMPPFVLLVGSAIVLIALNATIGLLDIAGVLLGERAAERIGTTLRQSVFDRGMTLSPRWHDRMRSGELVSRLTTDVSRLLDGIVAAATTVLPDTVMVGVVLVILGTFDPQLALVGLVVTPVLAVLAIRQRRSVKDAQSLARSESGRLAVVTNDLVRNVRAVQAFGRIGRASAIFGVRNRELLRVDLDALGVEARWNPMADLVLAAGAGVVLVVGGSRVTSGDLTVGSLLVVLAYLNDLYAPVRGLAKLAGSLAKAGASAARVREVLTADEAVTDVRQARTAPLVIRHVRFENVGFAYEPGVPVLRDFNLTIHSGEVVCLSGQSGEGKSTVLHLLLRLYDVDAGRILLNDVDIRSLDRYSLRRRIAFVPQDPWLLDATIADNIAFGSLRATRAAVLEAGRATLVDEFAMSLPQGYDTPVGEGGVRLSGGQRRRVALARAAVSQAPIVLLDEPTTGLDPQSAKTVLRAIQASTTARTVLLVSHDRDLAAIADRTVRLTGAATPVLATGQA